jgi:CheY-like chemotaxis protein
VRTDARELLARLNTVLAQGEAGPPDLAAARSSLTPLLERLRAATDTVRRQAMEAGAGALAPDVERIRAATERLGALLGEGGMPGLIPERGRGGGRRRRRAGKPRSVILVVDDNEENRDLLMRRLRRPGLRGRGGGGRLARLDVLARTAVDLVLLDVMMPDLDGYAVLQRIKGDPALRDIPVLMISALDQMDSVVRCIQLGADDYLGKPFDPVLLQARVGACLEKKRLHDVEARHRRALAEMNHTLEQRVADQVAQLERLGRLKRFFSPQLAELIVAGGAADPLKTHRGT